MITHRTPLKKMLYRFTKAPKFNWAAHPGNEVFDTAFHVEEYRFIPQKAVAVQCEMCAYLSGRTIILYTEEEVSEHAALHDLMRAK